MSAPTATASVTAAVTATSSSARVGWGEKLAFGCGDFASVLYWQTFMAYLLFFYTDVFGISPAVAGTMFLVSRLWDGFNDPAMGMVADRTETRWGKFRPYLLWLCVPFAFVGVLTFTTPDFGATGKIFWAFVTFNLLMMLYTAINIPYTALLGVITPDPAQRTSLAQVKFLFAFAAGSVVSATLLPMAKTLGGEDVARGWQVTFLIYGVAFIAFILVAFLGTRERVRPVAEKRSSVKDDLRDLFNNRPWVILLFATLTLILFLATRITATTHYFKYYVGVREIALPELLGGPRSLGFEALVSVFNTAGQMSSIGGVLMVGWLSKRIGDRKRTLMLLFLVSILSTAAYYVLRPENLTAIFLLQVVGCITGGPISPLLVSMYADTADYGEWKTGRRATGLVFSASTMGQKMGWAIGSACAGWLLSAVGFQPNVEQSPETLHGLVLLVSLIPAAFGVLSLGLLYCYPLDEKRVTEVGRELELRRSTVA